MRILMVIGRYLPHPGGTQIQAQRLACALRERGVEVSVLTGRERGWAAYEEIEGVPVHRLWVPDIGVSFLNAIAFSVAIYRQLLSAQDKFDLLHIHQALYPAYVGVLAAKRLGKPTVIKIASSGAHLDLKVLAGQAGGVGRFAARTVAKQTSAFIALNPSITTDLQAWGVPASRIHHIPNGIEVPPESANERLMARQKLGLSTSRPILLCVASLRTQKNHSVLIEALKQVVNRGFNPLLLLLGDGNLREPLQQQVAELGLNDHVRFCGWVKNVSDYLPAADLFVLPSRVEGLSNALMEAMAYGLPCIASDIPGNRILIQAGQNGLTFAHHDAEGLANAILALLSQGDGSQSNATEAKRLGEAAYQTIMAEYSIEQVAERYLNLYQTLLDRTS